jgi:hypothetical protein
MRGMETFTLVPRGPFSLAASIRFLEGFTPASYSSAPDGVLELAFPAEGSWRTVGVRVSQAGEKVDAEIVSPAKPGADLVAEVRPQVERILSLDVDGSGFPEVGELDPVVGEIQRRYPGLRPVGFWSPYEAAAWTIIGHRIRITQAAAIKARMAERLGEPVSFGGRVVHAFPSPQRLASLDTFPAWPGASRSGSGRWPGPLRRTARRRPAARHAGRRRAGGPEETAGIGTSPPGSPCSAARTPRTPYPARSRGWPARSRSPTDCPARPRPGRSFRSVRTGGHTGPGSRCCCEPGWSTRPARSPAGGVTPGRVKLGSACGCV